MGVVVKRMYDVQVMAWKPSKIVTIARFESYNQAKNCVSELREIGFNPILSWKLGRGKSQEEN